MLTLTRADGYLLSTDPTLLDLDRVHHWLSTDTYWALGRDRETVVRAFANSIPFGVYRPGDRAQVAVARVVTDRATFGWLSDVYVDRAERGRGLGNWIATTARDELTGYGVYRILLSTDDAQGVYERVGFSRLNVPERWMQIYQRNDAVSPLTGKD